MRRGWGQLRRLHNKRMPRWAPVGRGGSRWVPARALPGCLSAAVLESGQEKGGGGEKEVVFQSGAVKSVQPTCRSGQQQPAAERPQKDAHVSFISFPRDDQPHAL